MRPLTIIISLLFLTACNSTHLAVIKLNNKFGCINRQGEIVIEPKYDWMLQGYKNNQILVEKDLLYGFVNKKGKFVIEPKYEVNRGSSFE
jgi:hypothetical protein